MKTSVFLLFVIAFCFSAQAQIATTIVYVNSGNSISDTFIFGDLVNLAHDLRNGDISFNTYSVISVDSWSAAAAYFSNHLNENVEVAGHGLFDENGNFTGQLAEANSQVNGNYPSASAVKDEINPAHLNYCGENGTNALLAVDQLGQKIADKTGSIYFPLIYSRSLMLDAPNWLDGSVDDFPVSIDSGQDDSTSTQNMQTPDTPPGTDPLEDSGTNSNRTTEVFVGNQTSDMGDGPVEGNTESVDITNPDGSSVDISVTANDGCSIDSMTSDGNGGVEVVATDANGDTATYDIDQDGNVTRIDPPPDDSSSDDAYE